MPLMNALLVSCVVLLWASAGGRSAAAWQRRLATAAAAFTLIAPPSCHAAAPLVGVIAPGFQLRLDQYTSYATALAREGVVVVQAPADAAGTVGKDAAIVLDALGKHSAAVQLLVGHSRGGAVMALAAAVEAAATDAPSPYLALLDPVDMADGSVLRALASIRQNNVPARVLVVSLPYGGYSAYYKTAYESACAPAGRNGEAFYTAYASALSPRSALHVTVQNAGHLQLLDR